MAQQTRQSMLAGRYRLLERIGTGGMASVHVAEDTRLGRRVAVKRLHADTDGDAARRFEREAKLLAALNHPNVVAVYDAIADEEGLFIVMELVEGETLRDALDRGPLPPDEAVAIVRAVAAALDHAHRGGVIHRDVKPANVLLGGGGAVKLADLGIATAAERTQITSAGTVLGTASYMAPEQLTGAPLDAAVDVYALAAVAFETLSGRKAREGRSPMEVAHQVTTTPPPDLREAWPDAPAAVADVLRRGMAREPRERPPSAGALAGELERALAARERTAPTARLAATPAPSSVLKRTGAWIPLALLLFVTGLVVALSADDGSDPPEERGEQAPPAERSEPRERERDQEEPAESAAPAPGGVDEGLRLQQQGFEHMQAGRYEEAIEASRRAVDLLEGSGRLEYGYALFNLGRSLRLAGRPAEAIPVLEQRLRIPNQTGAVEAELALAREAAGVAGGGDEPGNGKGNGKGQKKDD